MQSFPINWYAVAVAALVKVVVGGMWFSPMLFLRPWQQLTGNTDESMKGSMAKAMALWILSSFVMAFVLVHAVHYAGATTAMMGAAVGFLNWAGFVFVPALDMQTATKGPTKLLAINSGSHLVSLAIMGAILAVWT